MGRTARGVKAVTMQPPHRVVGADLIRPGQVILMVSARGFGKRVAADDFRPQRRGGKGIIGMKISKESGPLTGFMVMNEKDEDFIIVTAGGGHPPKNGGGFIAEPLCAGRNPDPP